MSMSFIGPSGSCESPWIRYALLRDNVMHHLESGTISSRFMSLYSMAAALGGAPVTVSARRLHDEAAEIVAKLLELPRTELAISARTQAVIRFDVPLPLGPPTMVLPDLTSLPWVSPASETLGAVFGSLARDLLRITSGASEVDQVQVIDT